MIDFQPPAPANSNLGSYFGEIGGRLSVLARWMAQRSVLLRLLRLAEPQRRREVRLYAARIWLELDEADSGLDGLVSSRRLFGLLTKGHARRLLILEQALLELLGRRQVISLALPPVVEEPEPAPVVPAFEPAPPPVEAGAIYAYVDALDRDDVANLRAHAEGWLEVEPTTLARMLDSIRASPFFDEGFYRASSAIGDDVDAALHYLAVGEKIGLQPSEAFDPLYYEKRYPALASMQLLLHYTEHGLREGRVAVRQLLRRRAGGATRDPARPTVLVVVHQASLTGAPILAWNVMRGLRDRYDLVCICMEGGTIHDDLLALSTDVYGPLSYGDLQDPDVLAELGHRMQACGLRYAIVNSTESRGVLGILRDVGVPTVFLVHEYAFYVHTLESIRQAFDLAGEIVFPSAGVRDAALEVHPALEARPLRVMPQGRSVLPSLGVAPGDEIGAALRARLKGSFVVLGAGSVQFRKGVDFFLCTAAAAVRQASGRPVHFLWVGPGYDPESDMGYSIYLREQVRRADLEGHVTFLPAVRNLDAVYALADAFMLTSRLDPLPNVAIDVASLGIPLVCFEGASGMAEIMQENPSTAGAVVPYADADAAAGVLLALAADRRRHAALARALKALARRTFDMAGYVDALDRLGVELADRPVENGSLTK